MRRPPPPLLASYILSSMMNGARGRDHQGSLTFLDPFEMMSNGRLGDYVINESGASAANYFHAPQFCIFAVKPFLVLVSASFSLCYHFS